MMKYLDRYEDWNKTALVLPVSGQKIKMGWFFEPKRECTGIYEDGYWYSSDKRYILGVPEFWKLIGD